MATNTETFKLLSELAEFVIKTDDCVGLKFIGLFRQEHIEIVGGEEFEEEMEKIKSKYTNYEMVEYVSVFEDNFSVKKPYIDIYDKTLFEIIENNSRRDLNNYLDKLALLLSKKYDNLDIHLDEHLHEIEICPLVNEN